MFLSSGEARRVLMVESVQLYITPKIHNSSNGLYDYPSYCCELYIWSHHFDMGDGILWS
jgi:hypothetical protein